MGIQDWFSWLGRPVAAAGSVLTAIVGAVLMGLDVVVLGLPGWSWLVIGLCMFFLSIAYLVEGKTDQSSSRDDGGGSDTGVGLAEAASHITGETYRVLFRGEPYPEDLADAFPVIQQHTQHLNLGPPPSLDFVFCFFNAHPFEASVVGQLEGVIRVRRHGSIEPLARPPILIERFDKRPYLHNCKIVIRQQLNSGELDYLRHELRQEMQAFNLGAVRVWFKTSDPQRENKRYRLPLKWADMPAGLREQSD